MSALGFCVTEGLGLRSGEWCALSDITWVDATIAVASILAAAGTWALFWLGKQNLPAIRQRLTASEYVVDEMHELLLELARSPDEQFGEERSLADPVLLSEVRVARHDPVFDRIVFDFLSEVPGFLIAPLTRAELAERELRGKWGLSVKLQGCRIEHVTGNSRGTTAPTNTKVRPLFPALSEHMLIAASAATVEWALASPDRASYLPFELSDPPRLVIDILRQTSD